MLRRKTVWITILILLVGVLMVGCFGPKTAKVEISFDPNPVPYVEGEDWLWDTIFMETNGVGVTLTKMVSNFYNYDEKIVTITWGEDVLEEWLGSTYLPAFSSLKGGKGLKVQAVTHQIMTIIGTDDNGYEVETTARLDFLSE